MVGVCSAIDWPEELRSAIDNGLTVKQLSEKLGVTSSTINKFENRFGLKLKRIRSVRPHRGNSSGLDWIDTLSAAQDRGLSTTKLATELGMSLAAVLAAEDRTGIRLPRRRPDGRRVG